MPALRHFERSGLFSSFTNGDLRKLEQIRGALRPQDGDEVVATLFALNHNDRYVLVMHSFKSELEFLSPGIVAIDEMITHLIEIRNDIL